MEIFIVENGNKEKDMDMEDSNTKLEKNNAFTKEIGKTIIWKEKVFLPFSFQNPHMSKSFFKKGKFIWPDGSFYEGDFKYNLKEGFGVYDYGDGNKYEGEWLKDEKSGFIFLIFLYFIFKI